jgi:peroxiredoxin
MSLALAMACDKPQDTGSVALPAPPASPTPPTSAAALSKASPDVTFTLADGFKLTLSSLRGKVVAVVMCSSVDSVGCSREARGLAKRWREFEEHYVTAIGVVQARAPRGAKPEELPFEFAVDTDGQIARGLGVSAAGVADPTVVVVGRDGSIKATWREADPETHVRALLAEPR